jgi:hypothetical protein
MTYSAQRSLQTRRPELRERKSNLFLIFRPWSRRVCASAWQILLDCLTWFRPVVGLSNGRIFPQEHSWVVRHTSSILTRTFSPVHLVSSLKVGLREILQLTNKYWFAFGAGSRACIARNLANTELYMGTERLVESGVLRGASACQEKIEIFEWFNSSVKGEKIELIWEKPKV